MALLTRVLEVRAHAPGREILVDASISEVADAAATRTPFSCAIPCAAAGCGSRRASTASLALVHGDRHHRERPRVPPGIARGHLAAIDHVGAYDTSKSYVFGCG